MPATALTLCCVAVLALSAAFRPWQGKAGDHPGRYLDLCANGRFMDNVPQYARALQEALKGYKVRLAIVSPSRDQPSRTCARLLMRRCKGVVVFGSADYSGFRGIATNWPVHCL